MPDPNATAWEDSMLAEMRANDGKITSGPLAGHPILVMTNTGAKSGQKRRAFLTFHLDKGDYIVAGTAGGSPIEPAWVHNVDVNPDVELEVGNAMVPAAASVIAGGPERDRLWDDHVAELPWFGDYPTKTDRVIPMVRLTPTKAG